MPALVRQQFTLPRAPLKAAFARQPSNSLPSPREAMAPPAADTTASKAKKSKFNIAAAATPQGKRAVTEVNGKTATTPPTKVLSIA